MYHGQNEGADQLIMRSMPQRASVFAGGTASPAISGIKRANLGTLGVRDSNAEVMHVAPIAAKDEHELLFDRLVSLKVQASQISMHLQASWRGGLFKQLDCLLDHDNWHFEDKFPSSDSFRTLLRSVIYNKLAQRPGLGVTVDGNIVASWNNGRDRLTIECLPRDKIRYSLIKYIDGERISAAGQAPAQLLRKYLEPYEPELWFGKD